MLTNQTRWSLGHGKPLVPSRWQATKKPVASRPVAWARRKVRQALSLGAGPPLPVTSPT